MKIDHVAIVVRDLEETLAFYTGILKFSIAYREVIDEQSVEVIGLAAGDSSIELLRPLSEDSPIAAYRGSAATKLHHTAYRVDNLRAELARLKSAGILLIDEEPRRGAHGNMIAFLHPKSTAGVLIELCQSADTS